MNPKLCILLALALCAVAAKPYANGQRPAVSINDLQFTPATLTVKSGDTVVWTNNDDHDHSVVAADGSFRSGNLSSGQSFEHSFTKPGRYPYGCAYHPRQKGLVTVE